VFDGFHILLKRNEDVFLRKGKNIVSWKEISGTLNYMEQKKFNDDGR